MAKTKTAFVCSQCGNDSPKWLGKCPVCGEKKFCFAKRKIVSLQRQKFINYDTYYFKYKMLEKEKIKSELLQKLHERHAFWSYDKSSCQTISDWNLIKFVLIHLDIDDIDLLFTIYPKSKIKKVWIEEVVIQGAYLRNMNICFANLYFDIKYPIPYLKRMETYKLNQYNG